MVTSSVIVTSSWKPSQITFRGRAQILLWYNSLSLHQTDSSLTLRPRNDPFLYSQSQAQLPGVQWLLE